MTVASEKDYQSIGQLASTLRVTVRAIERAADQLGISPALRLNLIPHFDGEQVARLTDHLRRD